MAGRHGVYMGCMRVGGEGQRREGKMVGRRAGERRDSLTPDEKPHLGSVAVLTPPPFWCAFITPSSPSLSLLPFPPLHPDNDEPSTHQRRQNHRLVLSRPLATRPALTQSSPLPPAVDDPSRIVRVQGQDGKTSAPLEIAYTNCKVVGNGSFGVVFMAKLVRPQGGVQAVKREEGGEAGGSSSTTKSEPTPTTTMAKSEADEQQPSASGSSSAAAEAPVKAEGQQPVEVVEDIAIKKVLQDKRFKVRLCSSPSLFIFPTHPLFRPLAWLSTNGAPLEHTGGSP